MDILKAFMSYKKEKLIDLIKVYINNPILNLANTIFAVEQGVQVDEKLIKYKNDGNPIIYQFGVDIEKIRYYNLSKDKKMKKKDFDFEDIKYRFNNITNIKVEINNQVDDTQKEVFIKEKTLYISNLVPKEKYVYIIVREYADIVAKECNNVGAKQLLNIMLEYYYYNKNIDLPPIIVNSYEINRIILFSEAFVLFYLIVINFEKPFLKFDDLIKIDTAENVNAIEDLNIVLDPEIINKIKQNVQDENIPDYPIYYL